MPKINVYLPDDLAASVKEAQIPVSVICQLALQRSLEDVAEAHSARLTADGEWPRAGLLSRFSPRARQALVNASEHARQVPHDYVGTEHLLLGMLDDPSNLGCHALVAMSVELEDLRAELMGSLGPSTKVVEGHVPFNVQSKMALKSSFDESLGMRHNYIGCEHLLLGILTVDQGLGGVVMRRMGIEPRAARRTVTTLIAGVAHARAEQLPPLPPTPATPVVDAPSAPESGAPADKLDQILRRLEAIEERLAS